MHYHNTLHSRGAGAEHMDAEDDYEFGGEHQDAFDQDMAVGETRAAGTGAAGRRHTVATGAPQSVRRTISCFAQHIPCGRFTMQRACRAHSALTFARVWCSPARCVHKPTCSHLEHPAAGYSTLIYQNDFGTNQMSRCHLLAPELFASSLTRLAAAGSQEFLWLRPNRVVARAAAPGVLGGLDYLWLRSRVIVKLDPRRRAALAHNSEASCTLHPHLSHKPLSGFCIECV